MRVVPVLCTGSASKHMRGCIQAQMYCMPSCGSYVMDNCDFCCEVLDVGERKEARSFIGKFEHRIVRVACMRLSC